MNSAEIKTKRFKTKYHVSTG